MQNQIRNIMSSSCDEVKGRSSVTDDLLSVCSHTADRKSCKHNFILIYNFKKT